ncbi:translation initiation factor IF-3, partial [Patescibacteria group bacterium]
MKVRINNQIRAAEVRVLNDDGENLGTMPTREAISKAQADGLDLIEISPNAKPPIVKITDYGKFQYDQKKKQKETKAKASVTETKVLQVKIGT